jgi:tetratricopeptide (TPR) repeat protein
MSTTLQETLRRALALRAEGKAQAAESLCDAVLALDPDNADAWHITGLARLDQGMNASARDALSRAAALAPDIAGFHVNLATAFDRLGKPAHAIESLLRAIALQEDLAEAHHNLGNAFLATGRVEEAAAAFEKAVALRPGYAEALNNLGHISTTRGDQAAAIGFFRRAIDAEPRYEPAWANLCGALVDLGRTVEAIDAGRRAVLLAPKCAKAHYNLGNAFAAAPIPAEAAACYRRALQIDPRYADAFVNLGVAQINLGDCYQAIAALDHALALDADLAEAGWNKALALLLSGRLDEAWDLYEWRWQAVKGLSKPEISRPLWDGGDGTGRTILIRCEQGYGDAMQMVRYLPWVRDRGWRVALECPRKLARLFADSGLADAVIPFGAERPAFDAWLPIMSLPRVFATELATIPSSGPYLKAASAPRVHAGDAGLTVGIVWQGSLTNDRGRFRSCALSDLAALQDVTGVALCSLQAQIAADDRRLLERLSIPDLETGLSDFADTAAAVRSVDLVITVDTAMAHLAGALGRPVWTVLSAFPDWRWMLDRDDSPWYPTMRLFRQRRGGDWAPVVQEAAAALQQLVEGGGAR